MYTGFGARDRSEKEKEYHRTVYGPEAAEQGIEIARQLIEKARIAKGVTKPVKLAFDEWNGWDEELGSYCSTSIFSHSTSDNYRAHNAATPQNGLEQFYNLTDALSVASWLNVFIRQSETVKIACLAQSVNVISPIITSPTSFFRQTTFHPLRLFSNYMRGDDAFVVTAKVVNGDRFSGETLPTWIGTTRGAPEVLDVSAVLCGGSQPNTRRSLRIAVVNRSRDKAYELPLRIAFESIPLDSKVQVHEVWHEDVNARNGWGDDENKVAVKTWAEPWNGRWKFKEHSFTMLVLDL